jgi:hypothetical protein
MRADWIRAGLPGGASARFGSIFAAAIALSALDSTLGRGGELCAPQPDVAGLKLGMTVEQAKEQLAKQHPGIQIVVTYATDDPQLLGAWANGGRANIDDDPCSTHPLRTSKFKVAIEMIGGSLHHAQDANGNEISNPDTPIHSVQGDWFGLRFTPNDGGGRLYAIAQATIYGPSGQQAENAPSADELNRQFREKYGAPSYSRNPFEIDWIYDLHGRLLPGKHVDFRRCLSGWNVPKLQFEENNFTLKDYHEAFKDPDGAALNDKRRSALQKVFHQVKGFVPRLDGETLTPGRFWQCGVQLQIWISESGPPEQKHVDYVVIFLSDQNALYFDNGIESYILKQFLKLIRPVAASPKEKL